MTLTSFIIVSSAVLMTPGPTNTILAAFGAVMGVRRAILLPFAEALGYVTAVSLFVACAEMIQRLPAALPILKALAAVWLLYSAALLWIRPAVSKPLETEGMFWRVFMTTVLNPKAMLVGTVLIPALMQEGKVQAVAIFFILSILAGACWTIVGASMPTRLRRHSYKGAALVLAGFSLAAALSAFRG
jgi:threonine/homoserine/homoserine lactone efflux protein